MKKALQATLRNSLLALAISCLIIALYTGCTGGSSDYDYADTNGNVQTDSYGPEYDYNSDYDSNYDEGFDDYYGSAAPTDQSTSNGNNTNHSGNNSTSNNQSNKQNNTATDTKQEEINLEKLVYSANINLETLEFDTDVKTIKERIIKYEGIIQSENFDDSNNIPVYSSQHKNGNRSFSTVVRVPTSKFREFISGIETVGHVLDTRSWVENITQDYYSNKAYLDALYIQLDSLQEMLKNAVTIDEMLQIQDRLVRVQSEINGLTTKIQSMDRDVAYSIVTISVKEVIQLTEKANERPAFWDEAKQRMKDSYDRMVLFFRELFMLFIDMFWGLLFFVLFVCIVVSVILLSVKCAKKKHTKLIAKKEAQNNNKS